MLSKWQGWGLSVIYEAYISTTHSEDQGVNHAPLVIILTNKYVSGTTRTIAHARTHN